MKYSDFYSATANLECPNMVFVSIDLNVQVDDDHMFYVKMVDAYDEELALAARVLPGDCAHLNFELHHGRELAYGEYSFALFDGSKCVMVFTARYREGRSLIRMRKRKPYFSNEYTISNEERMRFWINNFIEPDDDLDDLFFDESTGIEYKDEYIVEDKPVETSANDELKAQDDEKPDEKEKEEEKEDVSLEELMAEINMLEGMDDIKRQLQDLFCLMRMNAMRDSMGISSTSSTKRFHSLYMGNPGTGKTTLAKMVGRVFHKLGFLSKGDVCVHSRTDLVGNYIGDTENKMAEVLEESRGNVLFIDEAYSLFNGRTDDRADYGNVIINSLLPVLTEPNPDMVIILAGYPNEMKRMLSSNPGLRDRFPQVFNFKDYDVDTLYNIGKSKLLKMNFFMTEEAAVAFRENILKYWEKRDKDFANARWIENIVETGIVQSLARRLFVDSNAKPTKKQLQYIQKEDVEEGFSRICNRISTEPQKEKKPIGFTVNR